jgi:predicted N-acetyltransferase YhbS
VIYRIVSLQEQPLHLTTAAAWIHRQWWSETDTPVEATEQWLTTHLGDSGFPVTLIAVSEGEIAGTVSLHESEAEDRPVYKPYLGALFVRPDCRGNALGVALVRAVEVHAARLGHSMLYLNAGDATAPFYQGLGWEIVERRYGRKRLNIMRRALKQTGL